MIEAKFKIKKGIISMKLTGHAGFDEKGRDIVCASATAYAYMVAQRMNYSHFEKKLEKEPFIKMEEGNIFISVQPKKEFFGEVLNTYFDAEVGMELLSQNYPGYVTVHMFNRSNKA